MIFPPPTPTRHADAKYLAARVMEACQLHDLLQKGHGALRGEMEGGVVWRAVECWGGAEESVPGPDFNGIERRLVVHRRPFGFLASPSLLSN